MRTHWIHGPGRLQRPAHSTVTGFTAQLTARTGSRSCTLTGFTAQGTAKAGPQHSHWIQGPVDCEDWFTIMHTHWIHGPGGLQRPAHSTVTGFTAQLTARTGSRSCTLTGFEAQGTAKTGSQHSHWIHGPVDCEDWFTIMHTHRIHGPGECKDRLTAQSLDSRPSCLQGLVHDHPPSPDSRPRRL